jgi:4-amino-4-deoxy-L-arabinose transferase-like glycosyltransferase
VWEKRDQFLFPSPGGRGKMKVAPLLFWWGELTASWRLGTSELALRLPPLLAGLGGLLLVWRLARLTLSPLARCLAVGFLAVAACHVAMSTLIKPYAGDLLLSAALPVLAFRWWAFSRLSK